MNTKYTQRATIAVPKNLINQANQLACIMGESSADINTFTNADYQDAAGNLYAVSSAVVTDSFIAKQSAGITSIPAFAVGADVELAREAFDSIGKASGINLVIGDNAQQSISEMGLTAYQDEVDIV
jgi:hypothetical protein